jgi:hypothetical protein
MRSVFAAAASGVLLFFMACQQAPEPVDGGSNLDVRPTEIDAGTIDGGAIDTGRGPEEDGGFREDPPFCNWVSGGPPCCAGLEYDNACQSPRCRPQGGPCSDAVPCCDGLACRDGTCVPSGMCVPAGAFCDLLDPDGCCPDSVCTIDWLDGTRCFFRDDRIPSEFCQETFNYACHSDAQCCRAACIDGACGPSAPRGGGG